MLGYMILGTVPVGIAGIAFKHAIEGSLRSLWVISIALIVVALVLVWIENAARHSRGFDDIGLRDAIIIGCAQALALVPGVSRSGITLVAAMALGLRRDAAARFSFLLGVPAIGAAGIFELPKMLRAHDVSGGALALGLIAAAVSGYASIAWLLRFLRARNTIPFVVYRIALGVVLLALLLPPAASDRKYFPRAALTLRGGCSPSGRRGEVSRGGLRMGNRGSKGMVVALALGLAGIAACGGEEERGGCGDGRGGADGVAGRSGGVLQGLRPERHHRNVEQRRHQRHRGRGLHRRARRAGPDQRQWAGTTSSSAATATT